MRRLNFLPVVFLLFATSVAALSFSSLIKQAEVIKVNAVTAATSTAITVSTTIRGFAANDPYMIKNLTVPKATFMTRFKAGFGGGGIGGLVKKNAWYAGWAASIAAAGWAIDELSDQVMAPSGIASLKPDAIFGSCGYSQYGSGIDIYLILPTDGSSVTFQQCLAIAKQDSRHRVLGPATCDAAGYCKIPMAYWQRDGYLVLTPKGVVNTPYTPLVSVTDDALFDSLITQMLLDPVAAAQAFMVPDAYPYPYPQVFPDTVPYIPGVAESDEEALNWYLQGLAQSTDPNAAYYVAPDRLQQIAALAQQLQQAQSPEGQTEALNDNLKNPLTQSQLEETLKKRDAANKKEAEEISATDKKPITDAYKDSGTKDEFDKLKERVSDPSKLPQLPPLPAADQIDLPSHTPCRTITMNMFNAVLTFPNPDQCTKLEQVKTGLGYLLYVLTALGIVFELYRRVE